MIALRRAHPVLRKEVFYTDVDIHWYGPDGMPPHWSDPQERRLACLILGQAEPDLYLMFNASSQAVTFVLPPPSIGGAWHLAVDSFRPTPQDLFESGDKIPLDEQAVYRVGPRSCVILLAQTEEWPPTRGQR
jgi:glycogen operon protein